MTTGIVKPELAAQFGAGGYVGRASGRTFDARRALAYAPYDKLSFEVPVRDEGDVNARVWLRIREVEQSLFAHRANSRRSSGRRDQGAAREGEILRGPSICRSFPRRRSGVAQDRWEWSGCALPFTRCVVVPMAAAGSGNRGKYRRRLSAL